MRDVEEKGQIGAYPTANLRVGSTWSDAVFRGFHAGFRTRQETHGNLARCSGTTEKGSFCRCGCVTSTKFAWLGNKSVHQVLGPFGPKEFVTTSGIRRIATRESKNLGMRCIRTVFAGVRQGYDADPATRRDSGIAARLRRDSI